MLAADIDTSQLFRTGFVPTQKYYPDSTNVDVPTYEGLFPPDEWTGVFACGLMKKNLVGAKLVEAGIGTGYNSVALMKSSNRPAHIIGTDLDPRAIEASQLIVDRLGIGDITLRQSDLLQSLSDGELRQATHIVGCVPQLPLPSNTTIEEGEGFSHYYEAEGNKWDFYGLGLNFRFIQEATQRAPQAELALNLSGRAGLPILKEMFNACGRTPEIIHVAMVPQHLDSSLQGYKDRENAGFEPGEFYEDEAGQICINGTQAEDRRLAEKQRLVENPRAKARISSYHKIYVIGAPGLG